MRYQRHPGAMGIGLLLAAVLHFAGCGSGTDPVARVTGTVTYNGEPVEGASVAFVPEHGRPASGSTDASGGFTLSTFTTGDGAVPGAHKVVIAAVHDDLQPMPGEPGYDPSRKPALSLPARYADAERSGFTAKVEMGQKNQFTFDMTD